jgi:DNA-binding NtrC family response regulator
MQKCCGISELTSRVSGEVGAGVLSQPSNARPTLDGHWTIERLTRGVKHGGRGLGRVTARHEPVIKSSGLLAERPSRVVLSPPLSGLADRERRQLIAALQQTGGNRAAAVRLLGSPRSTFYHRLARLLAEGSDVRADHSSRSSDD